ncbi:MAG: metallophosphoesterase family protein [Acidimicrobiales bacterium]
MKLLHTSDWHIGKTLRGLSRLDEQERVMAEIVGVATAERADVVLVVGDIFETAAPTPEAQRLAWRTLLDLRQAGAEVIVVAGNHDNAQVFEALRPVLAAAGIILLGRPAPASAGGVVRLDCGGTAVAIALLPFCSRRGIVRSAELLAQDSAANASGYADRLAAIIAALTESFTDDSVNVVAAHAFVRGGRLGGGERDAQSIEDYWVDATSFGTRPHYVALGHLHLTQQIAGGCPIWYSGSPIQVDFGEEGDDKHVLVVEALPGVPITGPRKVRLETPQRLRTFRGTFSELTQVAGEMSGDLLRVFLKEKARAGLADEVRRLVPNAVDVFIDRSDETAAAPSRDSRSRSPRELFSTYLDTQGIADERVERLFASLLDEETSTQDKAV